MSDSWIIYAKIRRQELDRELDAIARRREYKRAMKKLKQEDRNHQPRFHVLLCALGRSMAALGYRMMNKYGCRDNQLNPAASNTIPGIQLS